MNDDLEALKISTDAALAEAADLRAWDAVRIAVLGRNGSLTAMLRDLGKVPAEQKKERGAALNRLKDALNAAIDGRKLELEEAAASLGASRWQTFSRVIFPAILPALLTGFALAFARATGEYGSVIFIAGNMPMVSEITPLFIITKLEQYDYAGATAIAVVMLTVSFLLLLTINLLQAWSRSKSESAA